MLALNIGLDITIVYVSVLGGLTLSLGLRVCSNFTICTFDEIETRAPSPTQDRVCRPLAKCGVLQYASVPPTRFTDR